MTALNKIKIVSGGQTGVDRAALDAAIELGLECGGFCPKGRLAEDGIIPSIYPLTETISFDNRERTRKNIAISDGTLIFFMTLIDKGTQKTIDICKERNKPMLIYSLGKDLSQEKILDWINANNISTLNIAGPRESNDPGIYQLVYSYMNDLIEKLK